MTHLAFPTGNAAGFSPARGYVSRTHESRCASASTWPALIERALSYGLCRASTVRRALRDSNPSGALRRLGWDIHRRVRAKCAAPSQDIAPPLPKQLLQGRRLTSLSTARREEIAEWLLEACQAGLVSQADLSSALASPDTDSSLLTLAVNAWHALTDQVHADAQARGITGRERSSHAVAPGWALSVPDDQVEAVFLEHLDNCDVSSLDWNALSPVDTRAILIGLALLHRNLQSLVVFCPGSFYGEESMLGGMNDSVVEQFAGTHRFTDDSSPPIDLVAAYEAETGIDLLTDPEAWEGVKRLCPRFVTPRRVGLFPRSANRDLPTFAPRAAPRPRPRVPSARG